MNSRALSASQKISSRAELERLRMDRQDDLEHLHLDHPAPSWVDTEAEHPRRMHMRMRERRIAMLEKRLRLYKSQAKNEFEKSCAQAPKSENKKSENKALDY